MLCSRHRFPELFMRDRVKAKEFDKIKRQGSGNRSDRKSVKRRDQQSTMQGAQRSGCPASEDLLFLW